MTLPAAFTDLRGFLRILRQRGELAEVDFPVSQDLQITAIADREMLRPDGGKALLFTQVKGHTIPVLVNALGSLNRISLALRTEHPDRLAEEITRLIEELKGAGKPGSLLAKLSLVPRLAPLARALPRRVRRGPCQEVVLTGDQADLNLLPLLKCWPQDAGRYITMGAVITRDPETGVGNVGMYRLQQLGPCEMAFHSHIHHDATSIYHRYRERGERMPVAVAIGADPAVTWAACAPLPPELDELMLAGFVRGRPIELVPCRTIPLSVPAESEIVVEGYIDPSEELVVEGPFGDHTGYYSLEDLFPKFHLTAITMRKDPIYQTTFVGKPPKEDYWMGYAVERVFLPLLQAVCPDLVDLHMPPPGVFHNLVLIKVRKEYPFAQRRVMETLWGLGQMALSKLIVAFDPEVDLTDPREVMMALLDNVHPDFDLHQTAGIVDTLDHTTPQPLFGGKLGVDATSPIRGEEARRKRPLTDPEGMLEPSQVKDKYPPLTGLAYPVEDPRLMVAAIEKERPHQARELARLLAEEFPTQAPRFLVVFDARDDLGNPAHLAWRALNNLDYQRDMERYPLKRGDTMVLFDATTKWKEEGFERPWPDDIVMSPEVEAWVDQVWDKLGIR